MGENLYGYKQVPHVKGNNVPRYLDRAYRYVPKDHQEPMSCNRLPNFKSKD